MKKYNVGMVGYGWVATAHIPAINATSLAQVTAVCSSRKLDPAQLGTWITQQTSQSAAWMLTLEMWGQLFVRRRSVDQVQSEFLSGVAAA